MRATVGVMALQGAFALHRPHLERAGAEYREVLRPEDLDLCDALILPGGESGSMLKLVERFGLVEPIIRFATSRPIWGICAGAILLARSVRSPEQRSLDAIDIDVVRNAYGRHRDSFDTLIGGEPVSFIRAPVIERLGPGVISRHTMGGGSVWAESGQISVTAFHPELTREGASTWHRALVAKAIQTSVSRPLLLGDQEGPGVLSALPGAR